MQGLEPLDIFRRGEGQPRVYWHDGEFTIAAVGVADRVVVQANRRFSEAKEWVAARSREVEDYSTGDLPEPFPRILAGFAFDGREPGSEEWQIFGAGQLLIPALQVTRQHDRTWLTLSRVEPASETDQPLESLAGDFDTAMSWLSEPPLEPDPIPAVRTVNESSRAKWLRMVRRALKHIQDGDVSKVVLARRREVILSNSPPLALFLERLGGEYPDCFHFAFEPDVGRSFWGGSPELLADVRKGRLRTMALAGSARRGDDLAEDDAQQEALLGAAKEQEEHQLVVAAITESLEAISDRVSLERVPSIRQLSNIQHLQTRMQGSLKNGLGILDGLAVLHPTPALCGTPRAQAGELIRQLEETERGWFGGPVGWMDLRGQGLFAVGIRSALIEGRRVHLFGGAGIVQGSDPELEWNETALKLNGLESIIQGPDR
ncbi:MAG: isochorismate synthase [Chloroflexi bacterium]|nr:isochorismate synthase [Chloroflexota bacterium]